jgi:hypothetical protein
MGKSRVLSRAEYRLRGAERFIAAMSRDLLFISAGISETISYGMWGLLGQVLRLIEAVAPNIAPRLPVGPHFLSCHFQEPF